MLDSIRFQAQYLGTLSLLSIMLDHLKLLAEAEPYCNRIEHRLQAIV